MRNMLIMAVIATWTGAASALAQEPMAPSPSIARNNLYVEVAGPGFVGVTLNYERLLSASGPRELRARVGGGPWTSVFDGGGITLGAGANAIWKLGGSDKRAIEADLGVAPLWKTYQGRLFDDMEAVNPYAGIGYRRQPQEGGLVVRATLAIMPILDVWVWPGVSVGAAF